LENPVGVTDRQTRHRSTYTWVQGVIVNRYKPYPKYKDSGIEWLGEVPEHWEVKPIKFEYRIVNGATPKSTVQEYWDGDIVWITPTDLSNRTTYHISQSNRTITFEGLNSCGTTLIPTGSVVITTRAPIGNLAIANTILCTNQGCKSIVPLHNQDTRFLYYLLLSSNSQLNNLGKGTTFMELNSDDLGAFFIPSSSKQEQTAIANFLDRETAKIDTLIDKQRRLIELLKEKRQALISHAVTKGLDPNVKMKDSGVEWLGEVPEHWEIWKLSHAFDVIGSGTTPKADNPKYYGGHIPWITTGELRENIITDTTKKLTMEALKDYSALKIYSTGAVVIAMYGATIGRLGRLGIKATVNQACCVIDNSKVMLNSYLYYWLMGFRDEIVKLGYGGGQPNISQDIIINLKVSAPSIEGQQKIVNYLDTQTQKIDTLIEKANQAITLLQERRTALISAAVTGKIDVREDS